jgi:hypothetical protein
MAADWFALSAVAMFVLLFLGFFGPKLGVSRAGEWLERL